MQFITWIFSWALNCKNLSNLAEEWSGPWPSYPWGNNITSPLALDHFISPEVIYWSIIIWAPLAKSPNCASHKTSDSGSDKEYPNSKPSTANSDKSVSITSNFFCFFEILFNGTYLSWFSWFLITACLWLKVPLPESWPESLTGKPSSNNVPKASVSAVDQSIGVFSVNIFLLNENIFCKVLWAAKPFGILVILSPISKSFFLSTPLFPRLSLPGIGLNLDQTPSNHLSSDL